MDCDYLIIGSGFGGSVAALRLVEKGYSVCVVERGRRFRDEDFPRNNWQARRYLWAPLLRCFGIQAMTLFRNVLVLSGSGVGGGSLVYANTLVRPGPAFFEAPDWRGLADWQAELAPHYDTAERMLGATRYPRRTWPDEVLEECARDMGREHTFRPTDVAVFFGEPGKTVADPYFGGEGPERTGCTHCGGCMVGCRVGAKNTLVKNYLWLAERRGARILAEREVVDVRPIGGPVASGKDGYEVATARSTAWFAKDRRTLRARNVVFAAGVLGTLKLLFRCKLATRSLPRISDRLGDGVRTNSEAIVGLSLRRRHPTRNFSDGVAITSIFAPDEHTSIEPVRYSQGSSFMRLLAAPMADGHSRRVRLAAIVMGIVRRPRDLLRLLTNRDWTSTSLILLVMQHLDNKMRMTLGRSPLTLFRRGLVTAPQARAERVPSYIPIGNEVTRALAAKVDGIPQSALNEALLDIPTTAHVLGGCGMAASAAGGVVDAEHRVFGYEGLFVCDGSVIPANLGVNPSLTITAMTERAMSRIEGRG